MELKELIDKYGKENDELKVLKKVVDKDNSELKKLMTAQSIENTETDTYKASCKVIKTEKFNETKLIEKLKELGVEGCIKTKEYVDMEELENAIYNGELDATKLAVCKEVTETLRLTVSALK